MAPPSFSVALPAGMPPDERDALLQTLRPYAQVRSTTTRAVSPTEIHEILHVVMQDVMLVGGAVSAAAGAGSMVIKFANDLQQWRARMRQQGVQPDVRFTRGNRQLDLSTADDNDIQDWLRDLIMNN